MIRLVKLVPFVASILLLISCASNDTIDNPSILIPYNNSHDSIAQGRTEMTYCLVQKIQAFGYGNSESADCFDKVKKIADGENYEKNILSGAIAANECFKRNMEALEPYQRDGVASAVSKRCGDMLTAESKAMRIR